MTGAHLAAALQAMGLSAAGLRRAIMRLSGQELAESTVYRWIWKPDAVPAAVAALVALLGRLPPRNRRGLAAPSRRRR